MRINMSGRDAIDDDAAPKTGKALFGECDERVAFAQMETTHLEEQQEPENKDLQH